MRVVGMVVAANWVLAGCSGNDKDAETGGPVDTCESLATEPLGSIPTDEWPEGLNSQISTYLGIGGLYDVSSSCGQDFAVKVTLPGSGTQEDLDVVTTPWNSQLSCGCTNDLTFDPDSQYDHIAIADGFQFFIELFGAPGIDNSSLESTGVIYGVGEPLVFRSCAVKTIDPIEVSEYEQLTAVFRVAPGGVLSSTLLLAKPGGEVETCELSNFQKISD